ncbi:hypothetical protein LTS09_016787, partial [Friedmanniomyces endolithicus]
MLQLSLHTANATCASRLSRLALSLAAFTKLIPLLRTRGPAEAIRATVLPHPVADFLPRHLTAAGGLEVRYRAAEKLHLRHHQLSDHPSGVKGGDAGTYVASRPHRPAHPLLLLLGEHPVPPAKRGLSFRKPIVVLDFA